MQILGALAEMSFNTAFPAGWLLAKCGSRITMTSAMLMTSLGYSLIWVAVSWCENFQNHFGLFCFIFLLTGQLEIFFSMCLFQTSFFFMKIIDLVAVGRYSESCFLDKLWLSFVF